MTIKNWVLLALSVLFLFLGIQSLLRYPESAQYLDTAISLDQAVVLPENEGKLVLIHGTVSMTAPVHDEKYAVTLYAPAVLRYDEVYKQTKTNQDQEEWDWVSNGQQKLTGGASLGEFDIDSAIIDSFPITDYYAAFDEDEIAAYYLYSGPHGETYLAAEEIETGATSSMIRGISAEGQEAWYYRYCDLSSAGEMTLIGIQSGNRLVKAKAVPAVSVGVVAKEDLVSENSRVSLMSAIVSLAAGLACAFFGLRGMALKTRRKKG